MTGGIFKKLGTWAAWALIGWAWLGLAQVCRAQTNTPADLSPDVQEVLTLSRQHMDDSVITNYILSTGKSYKLSADDIIYLNRHGVSQAVISTLLQTAASANAQNPPPAAATAGAATNVVSQVAPPPVESVSNVPAPAASAPAVAVPSQMPAPAASTPMIQAPLQDNFSADGGLNSDWWLTQSPLLESLAAVNGAQVSPLLTFSPAGMQMSGTGGPDQFMGVQSKYAWVPPFTFSATVSGMSQDAVPFEIYLVSQDMQQWLSVAGHLGGRAVRHERVVVRGLLFPHRVVVGGGESPAPDYGIWINHTGNGWPISALGNQLYNYPLAGVPYTIQVSAGSDGMMTVTLMDSSQAVLASQSVPAGMGPFYVVLAGRDGPTYAEWQSVQLVPATPVLAQPATAAPVPASVPTMADFQAQLAPYGTWVDLPGYGTCWRPSVAPGWRPYFDGGHWEYTDAGWYWQSDYSWGDVVFHYGRWAYTDSGWVWAPGYQYSPAWVVWRHDDADGYVGWAPLPPGAVFANGGWVYDGRAVGADFDFGLGINFFTFVAYDHFWEHDYRHWVVPHDRVAVAWGHSTVAFHYHFDHGVFVNVGLPHDRMVVLTHHDFHPVPVATFRHDNGYHGGWQDDHHDDHNWHPDNDNHGGNHFDDHNQGGGWHH